MKTFSSFSGLKILVTGANGFIGTHLCQHLCRAGAEVYALSRKLPVTAAADNLNWCQGDLTDIVKVRELFSSIKPDLVFHLAGHPVGIRGLELVLPTFYNNLVATVNLLVAATEVGCGRLILAGSLEEPQSHTNLTPSSPYAASKWAASSYTSMFYELYQLPVVTARIFMVYGPGQQDLKKLVPYVTCSLLQEKAPKLSSGNRPIDWIYVEDLVSGLLAIAKVADVEGTTVDLGSGNLETIRTVVEHLVNIIGTKTEPLFGALSDRPLEQVRVADTAATYKQIGWKPEISLDKGLASTVDCYKKYLQARQKLQ